MIVVLYSAVVLWKAAHASTLEIHCLFYGNAGLEGVRINRIDSDLDDVEGIKPQVGDVLTAVNQQPIRSFSEYTRQIQVLTPGERVELTFQRPSEIRELSCRVPVLQAPTTVWLGSLGWFLLKIIIFLIGFLIVWHLPEDRSANAFFWLCVCTVLAYMGGFHWVSLVGSGWLLYPFIVCAVLVPPMTLHFYLLFPKPSPLTKFRSVWLGVYAIPVLACLLFLGTLTAAQFAPFFSDQQHYKEQLLEIIAWLTQSYLVFSVLMFLVSIAVLIQRFLSAPTKTEQNQVKWILAVALLASLPLGFVFYLAHSDPAELAFGTMSKSAMVLASLLFTAGYAMSITKAGLMRAGRMLNRVFLHSVTLLAAMGLFCLLVYTYDLIFVGEAHFHWDYFFMVGITVLLVLVLMAKLGDYFQQVSQLRFKQDKDRLDKAMRDLGQAVDGLVDPQEIVGPMLNSAAEIVQAEGAAVYLKSDAGQHFRLVQITGGLDFPPQLPADSPLIEQFQEGSLNLLTAWRDVHESEPSAAIEQVEELGATLAVSLENNRVLFGFMLLGPKHETGAYTENDRHFLLAMAKTTTLALNSVQGHLMIDKLRRDLEGKVQEVSEQRQRILYLQGELLNRNGSLPPNEDSEEVSSLPGLEAESIQHRVRGSSPQVRQLLKEVAKIAGSDSSVLVRGESGTGKELIAEAIHANSKRREGEFVVVNCSALSPSLLESELFGHVKGAFTGADRDKVGRFEMADCGTLFLDEIGDISWEIQTKLLRVLNREQSTFERVGGTESIQVNVRLIAATHRDLEQLIAEGKFRQDLYYRLNVISLWTPPLRERGEDVWELAYHFLKLYAQKSGKEVTKIDQHALELLANYTWPGNVRELENVIERAVVLADGSTLKERDLPPEVRDAKADSHFSITLTEDRPRTSPPEPLSSSRSGRSSRKKHKGHSTAMQALEKKRLLEALEQCDGNKAQAAKLLDMPRSTLFSKLKRYGID